MTNQSEQSAKNAHYPEPDYTHPDEMPIVEQRPNPHSDLRGTIVHFTSEMLDNPNNYGIYPTTNFYNDLEEAILDWHNKQIAQKAPTKTLSEQPAQHGTATKPIIADTTQGIGAILDRHLNEIYLKAGHREMLERAINAHTNKQIAEVSDRLEGEMNRYTAGHDVPMRDEALDAIQAERTKLKGGE